MTGDPYTLHDAAVAIWDGVVLGVAIAAGAAGVVTAAVFVFVALRGVWAVLWRVLVAAALVVRFAWRHAFPPPPPPPPPPRCTAHGWLDCPCEECRS